MLAEGNQVPNNKKYQLEILSLINYPLKNLPFDANTLT